MSPRAAAAECTTVLLDIDGLPHAITPGEVDDAARAAYTRGHGLAFAAAVSRWNGCGVVLKIHEPPFSDPILVHAWATFSSSFWVEIGGSRVPAMVEVQMDPGEVLQFIAPEDVAATIDHWAPTLPPQNHTLADQMVRAVFRPTLARD